MPDKVAAVIERVLAKDSTAKVVDRWRNGIRHEIAKANTRNQFVLDCSIGSYYYLADGVWQPVNTDWANDTSGFSDGNHLSAGVALTAVDGGRRLYPRRDYPDEYVELARPQYWTGAAWADIPLPERQRSGGTLLWDAATYAVSCSLTGDQVKLTVTLKSAAAAKRIRWPVSIKGLKRSGWQLLSGDKVVCEIPKPTMVDAKGTERDVSAYVRDGAVEFVADVTNLEYPIVIDPTLDYTVGASGDDGFNSSGSYGFSTTGSNHRVGNSSSASWLVSHGFARFTGVSGLDGATIGTSYLTLFGAASSAGSPLTKLRVVMAAAAAAPTSAATFNALSLSTAGTDWDATLPNDWTSANSPSLNSPLQELVDSYDPTVILVVHKDDGGGTDSYQRPVEYDDNAMYAPAIHIEYTTTTVYYKTLAGTTSSSGALARKAEKLPAGSLSSAGAAKRKTKHPVAGGVASSGSAVRKTDKLSSGSLATSGTAARKAKRLLAGVASSAGTVARKGKHLAAGVLASSGATKRKAAMHLVGTLTSSGGLVADLFQLFHQAVAGTLSQAGVMLRSISKPGLAGTFSFSGAVSRISTWHLTGVLGWAGAANRKTKTTKAGAVSPVGAELRSTSKSVAGTLIPSGTRNILLYRAASGTLSYAGLLVGKARKALAGTALTAGTLVGKAKKVMAGTAITTGSLSRKTSRLLAGSLTSAGSVGTDLLVLFHKAVGGAVSYTGVLMRKDKLSLAGVATSSGGLLRKAGKVLAGVLEPSGSVVSDLWVLYHQTLDGTLSLAGASVRSTKKLAAGTASAAGGLLRKTGSHLSGVLSFLGDVVADVQGLFRRNVGGGLSFGGVAQRKTGYHVAGSLAPSGAAVRSVSKLLAGVLAAAGALVRHYTWARAVSGAVAAAGSLVRDTQLHAAGVVSAAGGLRRKLAKTVVGYWGMAGDLLAELVEGTQTFYQAVSGALGLAGIVARGTKTTTAGNLVASGALNRGARKLVGASILTLQGTLHRLGAKTVGGAVLLAGVAAARRTAYMVVNGLLNLAGVATKRTSKTSAGAVGSYGALLRHSYIGLAGALGLAGGAVKKLWVVLVGYLSMSGTLVAGLASMLRVRLQGLTQSIRLRGKQRSKQLVGDISSIGLAGKAAEEQLQGVEDTDKSLRGRK